MEYLRNILYEYMMGKQPMVSDKIIFNFVVSKIFYCLFLECFYLVT